ncbi:MAG: hypothetical protein AAGE05_10575, partial [Pseudomonadota bacterium]
MTNERFLAWRFPWLFATNQEITLPFRLECRTEKNQFGYEKDYVDICACSEFPWQEIAALGFVCQNIAEAMSRHRPTPPPDLPLDGTLLGGREGVRAGAALNRQAESDKQIPMPRFPAKEIPNMRKCPHNL